MRRDGDLIPCSMTIALLAYPPRIVAFLVLKLCPPLMFVVFGATDGWVGHSNLSGVALGHNARVPTPLRDVAEVLKASAKSLAMMPHIGGVGASRHWHKAQHRATALAPFV